MANPLPPGAIPKLYRLRNKDGKEIGAWYCKISKKPVNLKTQDYFKARERAKEAVTGRRDFTDDRYFEETGAPKVDPAPAAQAKADDWTGDAVRAASQAITPDEIIPPPRQLGPAPDYGASTTGETSKPDDKPDNPETPPNPDSTQIPPEMMAGLIKQFAGTLVELQLHAQEYLWLRGVKINPGSVPADHDARIIPQTIWESQLKKWMPTDVPIPEWAAAIILTAVLGGTVQFEGATPLKKKDPEPAPSP